MWPNPQFPADLVTFTEESLNGKLHFLCSDIKVVDGIDGKQIDLLMENLTFKKLLEKH